MQASVKERGDIKRDHEHTNEYLEDIRPLYMRDRGFGDYGRDCGVLVDAQRLRGPKRPSLSKQTALSDSQIL